MIELPSDRQKLIPFVNELVEKCNVSVGMRKSYYRLLSAIYETGRYDGTKSLINTLPSHVTRLAAHLYSPVELKFSIDYENPYPQIELDRAKEAAKILSREWGRNAVSADVLWGRGVVDSLKYGAAFLKQWTELERGKPVFQHKLVMPWQIGVYREDENDLNKQEVIVETSALSLPEVWKRIYYLPNAQELYKRIQTHAGIGNTAQPDSFFHQVLSTSQLNTGVQSMTNPVPGGIVQLNNDPNYAMMGPTVAVDTVKFHELWVKGGGDDDYVTIQLVEPDILVAPLFQKSNLLGVKFEQPFDLIQPNETTNWIWGRSELVDLIEPQALLSVWADDLKRLYGLQVDKIIGFSSDGTITDERYDQMRAAGYLSMPQGSVITDLTPKIPPEALPLLRFCLEIINMIGGFPPVMQGQGDQGTRSGTMLDTMLKTASPTQRDRALLLERQLAAAAGKSFKLRQAKDAKFYWTDGSTPDAAEQTKFLLSEIPEDARVTVDSHSSSPIFADQTAQLIFQARKNGDVDSEYMLDNLPFPNKEVAINAARKRAAEGAQKTAELTAAAKQMPMEVQGKILEKQLGRK
jgi:hypothetical protein